MKEKLKPCPFCGKDPVLEPASWPGSGDYIVKCDNWKCNVMTSTYAYPKKKVIEIWNSRV